MMHKESNKALPIADLEFNVGPAGASEAVGALPCALLIAVIAAQTIYYEMER